MGTCGFVFDHESQDNSAVVALLRDVSKNPGLAVWHSLGTRRPLWSVPISAVTAALGGLRLGGVVVMAKVGLWMQEVSHSLTGSGGVWHNQSCHCEPPALSSGGGGVFPPLEKGAVKGLGGFAALWVMSSHPSLPLHSTWPIVCPHSTPAKGPGAPRPTRSQNRGHLEQDPDAQPSWGWQEASGFVTSACGCARAANQLL